MADSARYPLAHDQHCQPIDVPPEAVTWRVRRQTKGRPSFVYGRTGAPLQVPIDATADDLVSEGVAPGLYRLDALDARGQSIGAPAFTEIVGSAEDVAPAATPQHMSIREVVESVSKAMEGMHRTSVEGMVRTMEAMQQMQGVRAQAEAGVFLAMARRMNGPLAASDPMEFLKTVVKAQKVMTENHASLMPHVPAQLVAGQSSTEPAAPADSGGILGVGKAFVGGFAQNFGKGAIDTILSRFPKVGDVINNVAEAGSAATAGAGAGADPLASAAAVGAVLGMLTPDERVQLQALAAELSQEMISGILGMAGQVPPEQVVALLRRMLRAEAVGSPEATGAGE